ncbi:MAG TPA: cytidylate kinase-like family protein [Bryobacteraceae bacterium]|nr:cytidylate kinase-like family protein [Bryobacteraceae bacterium]
MIRTIAIEREFGSGAGTIARKLADRLGWTIWDEKITQEIANRLHCDVKSVEKCEQKPDSTFYRLMKTFMRGSYEERYSGSGGELLDAENLSRIFEEMVNEIADRGPAVIVGRASTYFLREREDHLALFLYAPYHEKMRRLLELGKSEEEAERLLMHVDTDRAAFVQRYYGKTWPQRDLYHLMINSIIGDNAVIDLVLRSMEILNQQISNKSGSGAVESYIHSR